MGHPASLDQAALALIPESQHVSVTTLVKARLVDSGWEAAAGGDGGRLPELNGFPQPFSS